MEALSQLVDDSLARNGVRPSFDHLRLDWSRWIRCESSFSVLLAPAKAGIFALAEEVSPPSDVVERRASSPVDKGEFNVSAGKRLLALFQISQTDDLGMALGRLFLPGNPLREKLGNGKCFARYAVIEDAVERASAHDIFQLWIQGSVDTLTGRGAA